VDHRNGTAARRHGIRGVHDVVRRAIENALTDRVTSLGAAVAYYCFLAIPSALLITAGVFSLTAGQNAIGTITNRLDGIIPDEAIALVNDSLTRLTTNQGTAIALLVVGTVLALWSLTGAAQNIMWALNHAYRREETRGFVRRRLTALAIVVVTFVAFALVFTLLVLGPYVSDWIGDALGEPAAVQTAWWTAQWPILAAGLLVAFATVLHFGPCPPRPRFRVVTIGAATTLLIWLVGSAAFSFYVSRFGSYNKAWGSLSAVAITLIWLWLSSVALLFGAEINAEIERDRHAR
jgi:membrane protein